MSDEGKSQVNGIQQSNKGLSEATEPRPAAA